MTEEFVGFYTIRVEATFSNGRHIVKVTDKLRVQVFPSLESPFGPDNGDQDNQNEDDTPGEKSVIIDGEIDSEVKPGQPIPYVESLSATGVLSLGWNRPMKKLQVSLEEIMAARLLILQNDDQPLKDLENRRLFSDENQFELKQAIEITIKHEEYEDLDVDWQILHSHSDEVLQIQI